MASFIQLMYRSSHNPILFDGSGMFLQIIASVAIALILLPLPTAAEDLRTGDTGSNAPFSNYQPSLAVNYYVPQFGDFPSRDSTVVSPFYTLGMLRPSAARLVGPTVAQGFEFYNASNPPLFSLFGTQ
ncbi:MAG: hypothetical protein AAF387_21000 [Pseudomonadota bacterium]